MSTIQARERTSIAWREATKCKEPSKIVISRKGGRGRSICMRVWREGQTDNSLCPLLSVPSHNRGKKPCGFISSPIPPSPSLLVIHSSGEEISCSPPPSLDCMYLFRRNELNKIKFNMDLVRSNFITRVTGKVKYSMRRQIVRKMLFASALALNQTTNRTY